MSTFYEGYYLEDNPDVAKAVRKGDFASGWDHFLQFGHNEARNYAAPVDHGNFNEEYYLADNPDVARAITKGDFVSAWQHYVVFGNVEGRSYEKPVNYGDFSEEYYLANNVDVAAAIKNGDFASGWSHYNEFGRWEKRSYKAPIGYGDFNEAYYLADNPDVAKEISKGTFTSAWAHYSAFGKNEGRVFSKPIDYKGVEFGGMFPDYAPGHDPAVGSTFTLTEMPPTLKKTFLWDGVNLDSIKQFLGDVAAVNGSTYDITFNNNLADGSADPNSDTINNTFGKTYYDFLNALFLSSEAQQNLITKTYIYQAPILTTTQVNAGVINSEGVQGQGNTSNANDTIVTDAYALHSAFINGGGGYNTLKVEMNGIFAQPKQLLNIQEVDVANMPNIAPHALEYSSYQVLEGLEGLSSDQSLLDLSRASQLQKLVVTEASTGYNSPEGDALTIMNIQNNATARLEGSFSNSVVLHYGAGLGSDIEIELYNVSARSTGLDSVNTNLVVAHDSQTLILDSQGGSNMLQSANLGAYLEKLTITGSASLVINDDLKFMDYDGKQEDVFTGEMSAAVIDASSNTGGVIISVAEHHNVQFTGTDTKDTIGIKVADKGLGVVNAGDGNDTVNVQINGTSGQAVINAGKGDDKINVYSGQSFVSINGNEGTDSVTLMGTTALSGSSINAEVIKIALSTDLKDAQLSNIASVVFVQNGQNLTITGDQFKALSAGTAGAGIFSTFNQYADTLTLIVDKDTTLGDLTDLSKLSSHIKLKLNIMDGAHLTITAEQLDKYVAPQGITQAGNKTGYLTVINAGLSFDLFDNTMDLGGSLGTWSSGYFDLNGDGKISVEEMVDDNKVSTNLEIIRSVDGYNRPGADEKIDTLTIDTTGTAPVVISNAINSLVKELIIKGDQNLTMKAEVDLSDDGFKVDFSKLNADITGLTIDDFEDVQEIKGNGTATRNVRVDVNVNENVAKIGVTNGLKSQGVQTYVVTGIADINKDGISNNDTATFYVCDNTKDVKTLGLQNNYGNTIDFEQVKWDVNFLMEGDGSASFENEPKANQNPDASDIGTLKAGYFFEGASAVVNVNNQGVPLSLTGTMDGKPRYLDVQGIEINNAASITINVADGNAIIETIKGDDAETLTLASANDVTVKGDLDFAKIKTINASGVTGTFTYDMTTANANDLSDMTLSGIEAVVFDNKDANLTLTADQILGITLANFSTSKLDKDVTYGELNVNELGSQSIDLSTVKVGNIGDVKITDTGDKVTLDAATNLGGADSVDIIAKKSDTTLELTAEQFEQIEGNAPVVKGEIGNDKVTGKDYAATMVITNLRDDEVMDLQNVATNVNQVIRLNDYVATEDAKIDNLTKATLEIAGGDNDLTLGTIDTVIDDNGTPADDTDDIKSVEEVLFTANSTLTLTAAQVATIGVDNFKVEQGVVATLNITDLSDQVLDLNKIQEAGINIGEISVVQGDITLASGTTLGGADKIIVKNADTETLGYDDTPSLTLTAEQFMQMADGTITEETTGDNKVSVYVNNLTDDEAAIDLTKVAVTGDKELSLNGNPSAADADNDVELSANAKLSDFVVVLRDLLGKGQTIRFATDDQANGCVITVVTDDQSANNANVVWLFDKIDLTGGKVDTNGYSEDIGRLYLLDKLVNGQNVENLYTFVDGDIIVRVVNTAELPEPGEVVIGIDRTVEVEAYTVLANGITFDDLDKNQYVNNLTIDLRGSTNIGNLTIDDDTVGKGDFNKLTINSKEVYPKDNGVIVGPDDLDPNIKLDTNIVGKISNGGSTKDLSDITLNATQLDLEVGEIVFSVNEVKAETATPPVLPVVTLTVTGEKDTTIASLNTTDANINELDVTNSGTGTLTVTGSSPALNVDKTEEVDLIGTGKMVFGKVDDPDTTTVDESHPGLTSTTLSLLDASAMTGDLDLGVITGVDSAKFTLKGSDGKTKLTLGKGMTLAKDGVWDYELTAADAGSSLTISGDAVLGAGKLKINTTGGNADIIVENGVNFTQIANADLDIDAIKVADNATMTITAEQASGKTITGSKGTVTITALKEAVTSATPPNLSNITAGTVNAALDSTGDVTMAAGSVLGKTHVTVSGTGTVTVTNATINDASFTVGTGSTLSLAGGQENLTTATADGKFARVIDGAGKVAISNLSTAADLSKITATTATATFSTSGTFSGDLGNVVVTVANGINMTIAASKLTGKTVGGITAAGEAGTVTLTGDTKGLDFSKVATENIVLAAAATIDGTTKLPTLAADQVLTLTAAQANGLTITGTGTVVVTDLEGTLAADLSKITTTTVLGNLDSTGNKTFTGNLGTANVTITGVGIVTMTGALASGHTIASNSGAGLTITDIAAGNDLSHITITGGGVLTIQTALNDLTLSAAQANGAVVEHADHSVITNVTITDLEDTPSAKLNQVNATTLKANLDSTGDVNILAAADLKNASVTISGGTGSVSIAQGAVANSASFVVSSGTLIDDLSLTGVSNIVEANVSGAGVLEYRNLPDIAMGEVSIADNVNTTLVTFDLTDAVSTDPVLDAAINPQIANFQASGSLMKLNFYDFATPTAISKTDSGIPQFTSPDQKALKDIVIYTGATVDCDTKAKVVTAFSALGTINASGADIDFGSGKEKIFMLADTDGKTYLYDFADSTGGDGKVQEGELIFIGTLNQVGIGALGGLTNANFKLS